MAECTTFPKMVLLPVSRLTKTSGNISNYDPENEGKSSIPEISAAIRVCMGKRPILLENKGLSSSIRAVCIGLKQKLFTGQEIIKKEKNCDS